MTTRRQVLASLASLAAAPLLRAAETGAPAPFRMAYFETYSPLSFRDGDQMRGILIDVLDEVLGNRLGLKVEHTGYPWVRAQTLVQRGESDAICTVATPARLDYAVAASEPVVRAPTRIFVRADNPHLAALEKVGSLDALKALPEVSILSYAGNGWAAEKLASHNVLWGQAFDSSLKMLVGRRGDVMVENAITMQYTLGQTRGGDAIRMLPKVLDEARFQLLVSKQSPHVGLPDDFDKALRKFKHERGYKAIFERYGVTL